MIDESMVKRSIDEIPSSSSSAMFEQEQQQQPVQQQQRSSNDDHEVINENLESPVIPMDVEMIDQPNHPDMTKPTKHSKTNGRNKVKQNYSKYQRGSILTLLRRPTYFGNETGSLPCGEFVPNPNLPTAQTIADVVDDMQPVVVADNATTTTTTATTAGTKTVHSLVQQQPQRTALSTAKVLVIGAGGLGCEILKNCAMCGIVNVHVIDLDSIDITNLNRQFLFRQENVGCSKAIIAAQFINTRCPWMKVVPHYCKIQDLDVTFYQDFDVIISGLDNIEARRWLNATIVGLVQLDDDGDVDPTTIIPIIDGGTEGFAGQARIILPQITSCFECTIDTFPPQTTYPLCTIAETPRRPEHCIAYAYIIQWSREFPDTPLDKDSPEHMKWIYEKAYARAQEYNIMGVTYMLTMGVVKNIIPAIASTNAIIAAACVHEAMKYITYCSQNVNCYMMYMGTNSIHTHTFVYDRNPDCPVCCPQRNTIHTITGISKTMSLQDFIQIHLIDATTSKFRLSKPSIVYSSNSTSNDSADATTTTTTLYMPQPPMLEEATRPNLYKGLYELLISSSSSSTGAVNENPHQDHVMNVTDPLLSESMSISIRIVFDSE